jgi:guanylate kinase
VDDFEKGRLDLSESLMNDTEARLELIKNRFPNITLFVMSYKNDSLDSALNSIAIVLNEEKIKMDQIHVSGFGQVHQHDFKIIY